MEPLEVVSEKTRRAYNRAADRYDELFHDELLRKPYDLMLLDSFARRFDPGARVLDAGCGPCAHAGRMLFDRGFDVVGVDISDRCVELARQRNPGMTVERADMAALPFDDGWFRGILAYYSIIDTPKRFVPGLFREFRRVLATGGSLLVAVKSGDGEGWQQSLLGIEAEIYVTAFRDSEIRRLLEESAFHVESIETREPYEFEIEARRIYAMGVAI